ncbi:Uncharacterized protein HZ326_25521 [Fusarium oxysporum f. sp. albedinis]|nr:Uncharacterized protein HZ326_25521 [Fusarium oxysporum f. sp. albedinis]
MTPKSVLINTTSSLKTIYNNKANVKEAVCYKVYPCNVHVMKTWNSIDKATDARKRRTMNHAFSDKALRSSEPFIHSNIDRWIQLLKEEIREAMIANSPFTSLCAWLKPRGLDYLLAAAAPPAMSKCNEEVFSESGSLIIAGSDTSAIGLAAAFFYLTRNPHAQEKHAKESRAVFSSVGGIQGGAALHSSQYLRAFIQRTMRMSPPDPTDIAPEVQQIVDEKDECSDSPESIYLAESAFMTFSAGPRGCVGKNLAYLEMSLTLAKTVYHFKIRRDHSSNIGGGSSGAINGRRIVDQYQL